MNIALAHETSRIQVDCGQSLTALIHAGAYDSVSDIITPERFPITDTGVIEFEPRIFHPGNIFSWWDEVRAADPLNVWGGTIERLLAYGIKYPDEQRKYPIIALGSVIEMDGYHLVACLRGDESRRVLDLLWHYHGLTPDCRFLGAGNVSRIA